MTDLVDDSDRKREVHTAQLICISSGIIESLSEMVGEFYYQDFTRWRFVMSDCLLLSKKVGRGLHAQTTEHLCFGVVDMMLTCCANNARAERSFLGREADPSNPSHLVENLFCRVVHMSVKSSNFVASRTRWPHLVLHRRVSDVQRSQRNRSSLTGTA